MFFWLQIKLKVISRRQKSLPKQKSNEPDFVVDDDLVLIPSMNNPTDLNPDSSMHAAYVK